jgi:hypothetical protein
VLKSQDLISQRSSVAVSHDASHNTTLELHQLMSQLQAAEYVDFTLHHSIYAVPCTSVKMLLVLLMFHWYYVLALHYW